MNGSPPARVDDWLAIERDGTVHAFVGKVDLGTGIRTAFAQVVADELGVPVADVVVVEGCTGTTPDQGLTVGSQSLQSGAAPLRAAAASAREELLGRAADLLGVARDRLVADCGAVTVRGECSAAIPYSALIGSGFGCAVDPNAPLRPLASRRYVGTSVARVDLPAKACGTFRYAQDLALAGMLHARIVRSPAPGAVLSHVGDGATGVRVVREGELLAVLAAEEWRAIDAARTLVTRWSGGGLPDPAGPDEASDAASTTLVAYENGRLDDAFAGTAEHEAVYHWPFQAHASIGPPCALADVRGAETTVWCATQGVYPLRDRLARTLGVEPSAVRVMYVEGSGCFGDNGTNEAAEQAVLLSRAVGAPVHVQWTLAEQLAWEPKGPAMTIALRGSLREGRIAGWEHTIWSPPHLRFVSERDATNTGAADRNAVVDYAAAAQRVVIHVLDESALAPSALRSLGAAANVFANESFVDELAAAAGADPLAFRLAQLRDPRARAVLERVASLADWTAPARPGTGRGLAYARYNAHGAYVAAIATCTLDEQGAIAVTDLAIAHDCGEVVNPDGLRNQIEGNAVQATSRALLEQVRYDAGGVLAHDWRTYPIVRFPDAPTVHIALIDRPELPPLGAGEPTTIVIAPAIANAVYALTGVRPRDVPFTKRAQTGAAVRT